MGFLLHLSLITTIYKRFVVYNFIYVFLHPTWWGDFCRISCINSTIRAIKLQTSMAFLFTNMICQHSTFFFSPCIGIFFEVIIFLYPTVPFPDLFKSCVFWEVPGARTTSARSQEADQPIKILDPGESNDTWAQHLQLGCGQISDQQKLRGTGGLWWSYPCLLPSKKRLKGILMSRCQPKNVKKSPRNNTMKLDELRCLMSVFFWWFRIEECGLGPTFLKTWPGWEIICP